MQHIHMPAAQNASISAAFAIVPHQITPPPRAPEYAGTKPQNGLGSRKGPSLQLVYLLVTTLSEGFVVNGK